MVTDKLCAHPRSLHDLIDALERVSDKCEGAQYSLDDVYELRRVSMELKAHADRLFECCT